MLATTNVLVKTEDGREALAERRHDMQMRQRHLLILMTVPARSANCINC